MLEGWFPSLYEVVALTAADEDAANERVLDVKIRGLMSGAVEFRF